MQQGTDLILGIQASHGLFGVGASNTHYLDKCVFVEVKKNAAGKITRYVLRWLSKKSEDWDIFAQWGTTAAERTSLEEITDSCICLTRS